MLAIAATICVQPHFLPTIAAVSSKRNEQAIFPHSLHGHTDNEVHWDTFEKRHGLLCLKARYFKSPMEGWGVAGQGVT